jgi:phosphatidylglycerophosphatase A
MKTAKIIASGLGTGYAPVAPGTAGSVLGITFFYGLNLLLNHLGVGKTGVSVLNLFAVIILLLWGVYAIKKVHRIWEHDSPKIVIDEIVGVGIAAVAVPLKWQYYLYALILFRIFDIVKPFGIKKLDNLKSDWSVMLDDVLAGVYAAAVLQLVMYLEIL